VRYSNGNYTTNRGRVDMSIQKTRIKTARETLCRAFEKDPDFREVYVANIACVIMDNAKGFTRDKAKRDALADKIMKHLFC